MRAILLALVISLLPNYGASASLNCHKATKKKDIIKCVEQSRSKIDQLILELEKMLEQIQADAKAVLDRQPLEEIVIEEPVIVEIPEKYLRLARLYTKLNKDLESYSSGQANINFIRSPKVDTPTAIWLSNLYTEAFSQYSKHLGNVTIVQVGYEEYDWYVQKVRELENRSEDFWYSGHCRITKSNFCAYGSTHLKDSVFYQFIGPDIVKGDYLKLVAYHEAVHAYQIFLMKQENRHPNCWIMEGHANALGFATLDKAISNPKHRLQQIVQIKNIYNDYKILQKSEWIKIIDNLDNLPGCHKRGAGYSIGMLIVENLYSQFGLNKTHEFIKLLSNNNNFDYSLQKVFGIKREQYLADTADYIVHSIQLLTELT